MLKLSKLFGDHAVLQRNRTIVVWGWCDPFTSVSGTLGTATAAARSGGDGRFTLRFPALPAGGPVKLTVEAKSTGETVSSSDLLIGEVWVASGQSNMQFCAGELTSRIETIRRETSPSMPLRMFTVPRTAQIAPPLDAEGEWQLHLPENVDSWSAVGLFFGRRLHRELNVPVGVIASSWGGTIAEAWTSREMLMRNPDFAADVARYELNVSRPEYWDSLSEEDLRLTEVGEAAIMRRLRQLLPPLSERGVTERWFAPEYDDSDWERAKLPRSWTELRINFNGIVWFRREVEIPAEWAGRDLNLSIGGVDKHDVTWFDGVEVGRTGEGVETEWWNLPRTYRIPGERVRAGRRIIAVRDYSFLYDGGMIGPAEQMHLVPADGEGKAIPLAGEWSYAVESNIGWMKDRVNSMGTGNPNSYGMLFDNMIRPLIPLAMRGVIWYQGESNERAPQLYRKLMEELIADWRFRWGQGDFPFLQVILAGFRNPELYQARALWPQIREAQALAAAASGNLTASAIDLGEASDIHPHRKQEVGERLALAALEQAYSRPVVGSGPVFREMKLEEGAIRLCFDHCGAGLTAHGRELVGFWIADHSRVFYPATAVISENTVLVSSPEVSAPVAVRYAWADNPEEANLYNSAGLPASSFRTDTWEV